MRMIASRPSRGLLPCAARPRVSTAIHWKPLCATATSRPVGSVTTAASARHDLHERVRAEARVLLVRDRRHDEPALRQAAALGDAASGADHRGDAAFHVLRSAAEQLAVANLGHRRARHAG